MTELIPDERISTGTRRAVRVLAVLVVLLIVGGTVLIFFKRMEYDNLLITDHDMAPTLAPPDVVMVNSRDAKDGPLNRWDIVVFQPVTGGPDAAQDVLRVVGLPGETVRLDADRLTIDGEPADPPPPFKYTLPEDEEPVEVTLPDGQLWLMGDNLRAAEDSRAWGPVPVNRVTGVIARDPPTGR